CARPRDEDAMDYW
nr:immunoglobulin heavy chain junction region [Mus musculus]